MDDDQCYDDDPDEVKPALVVQLQDNRVPAGRLLRTIEALQAGQTVVWRGDTRGAGLRKAASKVRSAVPGAEGHLWPLEDKREHRVIVWTTPSEAPGTFAHFTGMPAVSQHLPVRTPDEVRAQLLAVRRR